jgi:radical SAM/Cys-rich protein
MISLTLARRKSPLADAAVQRRILGSSTLKGFEEALQEHGHSPLRATSIRVLQVNVGKLCNQTCRHCHVDAGPERREIMDRDTMQACLNALAAADIPILDITGGAPEMNPHFRWFVAEARALDRQVIDRCNLTILVAPGYQDLHGFLAAHRVEIVASLPCYLPENTDRQRGDGVFARSIEALKRLNDVGYGHDAALPLTLVYNPVGPGLPPRQDQLEAAYRHQLQTRYGIAFTRLITITNMPISRFLADLLESNQYERYMEKLLEAFNPAAVNGLMCRTMISIGWDGRLYDCDFNQMLELGLGPNQPRSIWEFDMSALAKRSIVTGRHCFGCTAGSGSGCQGAIVG